MSTPALRFDAAYYRRHYRGRDRVHSAAEVGRLAGAVDGLCSWLGVEVGSVLDVGAGPGFWRAWYRRHRPLVRYRSVDVSPFACARYGHERRDISRWRTRARYDLVVCQGVLQYLDDAPAERAIRHLSAMTGAVLYLEAVTRHDLEEVLDLSRSDTAIHARPGRWYRERLAPAFAQLGAGLWVARRAGFHLYELEAAPVTRPGPGARRRARRDR
jgi:SAM-dependent methyltransferase